MRAKYVLYKEFEALSGWILIYAFVQLIQVKCVESFIYLKFNSQKELILPGVMHHLSKCLVCNTPSFFGIGGQKNLGIRGFSLCVITDNETEKGGRQPLTFKETCLDLDFIFHQVIILSLLFM